MKNISCSKGFSLVELSIVIIIIGFLIAGVSSGASLIRQAKLLKTIEEIQNYDSAVTRFKTKYGEIPGDMPYATSYWPSTVNGNGNGMIDMNYYMGGAETNGAWQHLSLAGLVPGSYSGTNAGNPNWFTPGINVPLSSVNTNAIYSIYSGDDYGAYSPKAVKLLVVNGSDPNGNSNSNSTTWPIVKVLDASLIDKKIDDGLPHIGKVVSWGSYTCINYSVSQLASGPVTNPRYMVELDSSGGLCVLAYGMLGYNFIGQGQ